MPAISEFYGIMIRMYFAPSEHPPPHFHARYADYEAQIEIATGKMWRANFRRAKPNWFWRGPSCIKMS